MTTPHVLPTEKNSKNDILKMGGSGAAVAAVFMILIQFGLIGPDAQSKEIESVRVQEQILFRLDRLEEKLDDQGERTTIQISELRDYTETRTLYRWSVADMENWAAQLRSSNPELNVPSPYKLKEQGWREP